MKLLSAMYLAPDPFFLFEDCLPVTDPTHLEEEPNSVLLLWGGADIAPSYYKQRANNFTSAWDSPSPRDRREQRLIEKALAMKMPIIGICRGAQFLCALAGGKLIQHVNGHGNNHYIRTHMGELVYSNSTHHQMMIPNKAGRILAWSDTPQSDIYVGEDDYFLPQNPEKEVEVVYWPKWKALGIQGHPEYMDKDSDFVKYCQSLVQEYILC